MQPLVCAVPWPRLVHRQHNLAGLRIDTEDIDYRRIGDTSLFEFLLLHCWANYGTYESFCHSELDVGPWAFDVFFMFFRLVLVSVLMVAAPALAQFSPALLQNDSYWGDGRAEFNIYDGQIMRDGAPRPGEVLHILVREPIDPKQTGAVPMLKLNQIVHLPIGLYV